MYLDFIARFTLLTAFQCSGIFKQRLCQIESIILNQRLNDAPERHDGWDAE